MRVTVIANTLLNGGLEKWLTYLIKYSNVINIQHLVVTSELKIDTEIVEDLQRNNVKIYTRNKNELNTIVYENFINLVSELNNDTDVFLLLFAPMNKEHIEFMASFKEKNVVVSQASGAWPEARLKDVTPIGTKFAAVSEVARDALPAEVRGKTRIIYNCVDLNHCSPVLSREEMRSQWGVHGGQVTIGFLGRLACEKDPFAAAKTVGYLGNHFVAIYYGMLQPWFSEQQNRDIVEHIKFLSKGSISFNPFSREIGNILNSLDILMMTSREAEGCSLLLLEAWACGLPTITTRGGAVDELERKFGKLTISVPVGATEMELAEAVWKSLGDEGTKISKNASDVVRKNFNIRKIIKQWDDFFKE